MRYGFYNVDIHLSLLIQTLAVFYACLDFKNNDINNLNRELKE